MTKSLINQFCEATTEWARKTGQDTSNIIEYAMFDTGGFRHLKPIGGVENPEDPNHHDKPMGEIMGHYTLQQLREYLQLLTSNLFIGEYVIIPGLIKAIEAHLQHMAVDFNKKRQKNLEEAEFFERVVNNPEEFQEIINDFKKSMEQQRKHQIKDGEEPITREYVIEAFRTMAATHRRFLADPDENEAERNYRVEVWRQLTTSILEYENIQKAINRHLQLDEN